MRGTSLDGEQPVLVYRARAPFADTARGAVLPNDPSGPAGDRLTSASGGQCRRRPPGPARVLMLPRYE